MSCSSNLNTPRRVWLAALAPLPWCGLAAQAEVTAQLPDNGTVALAGMRAWGRGEFRYFGLAIYEAALWCAGSTVLQSPLALQLRYRRRISGAMLAAASVREMRRLNAQRHIDDEATLKVWGTRMEALFPDVQDGDTLLGVQADGAARFYLNGRALGSIADAGFAQAFFDIWLHPGTSAPALRAALLVPPPATSAPRNE